MRKKPKFKHKKSSQKIVKKIANILYSESWIYNKFNNFLSASSTISLKW